jgi:hypothetical protein
MKFEDTIAWVLIVSSIACFLLSIVVACRKLPGIDRIFPFTWQIIFWIPAFSLTHGFPTEMFREMIFAFVWAFLALINSYRLYRVPMMAVRVFAFLQFIQAVSGLLLAMLAYISACWRYYGHIVWNP